MKIFLILIIWTLASILIGFFIGWLINRSKDDDIYDPWDGWGNFKPS